VFVGFSCQVLEEVVHRADLAPKLLDRPAVREELIQRHLALWLFFHRTFLSCWFGSCRQSKGARRLLSPDPLSNGQDCTYGSPSSGSALYLGHEPTLPFWQWQSYAFYC